MEKKKKYAIITFSIIALFPIISYFVFVYYRFSNENVLGVEDLPVEFRGGDFNTDGAISLSDFSIWLNGYREFKRSSVYSEVLDLDSNNKIDFTDFRSWLVIYRGYKEWVLNPPPLYTNKVLSLSYFPIDQDGNLDKTIVNNSWSEYNMTLEEVRTKVSGLKTGLESTLENGSKYHGYSNPNAVQSIDYTIIDDIEYLEAIPGDPDKMYGGSSIQHITDYNSIMNRVNICDLVDNQGVSMVWIWGYNGIETGGWESNMSSPYGDISNSDRDVTDLPICQNTYVVYELNYGRDVACATESHMHQLESVLYHLDSFLFETEFVGGDVPASAIKRCGNVHYPPNGESDYDYANTTHVNTDCMDWRADSIIESFDPVTKAIDWDENTLGEISNINCQTWGCNHRQWFEFWMQNMPGHNNGLTYRLQSMPNWWDIFSDLDKYLEKGEIVPLPTELPSSPLVAYWGLENLDDSSGNEFDMDAFDSSGSSEVAYTNGKLGQAVNFSRPASENFRISLSNINPYIYFFKPENFTIMAYIKRDNTACNYGLCSIFSKGSTYFQGYSMSITNDKLAIKINDDEQNSAVSTTTIAPGVWYHVSATYSASTGELKVYVNGILETTEINSSSINYEDAQVTIGNGNWGYDLPFFGVIDEVRFFNTALTQEQISSYVL